MSFDESTGCGRMDSQIPKGNKKRRKQVTEKSFIFSKSTYNLVFSQFGFENNHSGGGRYSRCTAEAVL